MTQPAIRRRKVDMPSGIRKKFTAALSMLLVAAIMMVGSTYAWFTLSTAPEVKGITTSIGANGNLEIALLNATSYASTAADLGIVSDVGDAIGSTYKANWTVDKANHTWGNLVDLSDTTYGLKNITLLPAALNITNANDNSRTVDTIGASILKVPEYGGDGRVIVVNTDTVMGRANGNSFAQDSSHAGVRAIGTAVEASARQLAYRDATSAATSNMNSSSAKAVAALNDNGDTLLGMVLKAARGNASTTTFTKEEVAALDSILTSLANANEDAFAAIKYVALATQLGQGGATFDDDAAMNALIADYENDTYADFTAATKYPLPANAENDTAITAALRQYKAIYDRLFAEDTDPNDNNDDSGARVRLDSFYSETHAASTTYTYANVKPIIDFLAVKTGVTLNGTKIVKDDNTTNKTQAELLEDMGGLQGIAGGITVSFNEGSGLFYDIAKLSGNYSSAQFNMSGAVFNDSLSSESIPTTISTNAAGSSLIAIAIAAIPQAPAGSGGGVAFSVDPYGYALDFGVRTNADGANLLLQPGEKQRIYNQTGSESQNTETLGAGSYLEFTKTATFDAAKVTRLMDAIRVVFAEPTANGFNVLAIAKAGTAVTTGDNVKAPLALYNYTLEEKAGEAPVLTVGAAKTANNAPDYTITALTKNQAKKITVIVYLDGDKADNTMVANAATSMSGKLNLQFTTDKALVPMENAALRGNAAVTHHTKAEVADLYSQLTSMSGYTAYLQTALDANPASKEQKAAVDLKTAADNVAKDITTDPNEIDQVYNNIDTAITAWNTYLTTQG